MRQTESVWCLMGHNAKNTESLRPHYSSKIGRPHSNEEQASHSLKCRGNSTQYLAVISENDKFINVNVRLKEPEELTKGNAWLFKEHLYL